MRRPSFSEQVTARLGSGPDDTLVIVGSMAAVEAQLRGIEDGEALFGALRELIDFARFLAGPKKSPDAARDIVAMVETVVPLLQAKAREDGARLDGKAKAITRALQQEKDALMGSAGQQRQSIRPEKRSAAGVGMRSNTTKVPRGLDLLKRN